MRQVGALLDAAAVHGGRTASAHLRCLARSNGIGRGRVGEVLEQVGLAEVAGRRVGGFSLGMRQRLGIAAALLGDPGVLMFDEPVNGLDPEGIRWIRELMRRLAGEGRTVLVSSHLMSEMALDRRPPRGHRARPADRRHHHAGAGRALPARRAGPRGRPADVWPVCCGRPARACPRRRTGCQ